MNLPSFRLFLGALMTMSQGKTMSARLLITLLILWIATWMRLDGLGLWSHFRYDSGTLASLVLDMVYNYTLPLTGIPSSAGVPNSPMTVYILTPLFAMSDNPWVWSAGIALWNVFGVATLIALVQRISGVRAAWLAGIAYAIHPYAVHYSTFLWAQNTHTPLILLGLWLGWLGFAEGRTWAQTWCWPVFVAGAQIHFAAWTLVPLIIWLSWQGRKFWAWGALIKAMLMTLLPLTLFALGLAQSDGATQRAQTILQIIRTDLSLRDDPLIFVGQLISGLGLEGRAQNGAAQVLKQIQRLDLVWIIAGLGFVSAGLLLVWRKPRRSTAALLWLWIWLTPLAFIPRWTGTGVYIFYLIPSIPALMWSFGVGADDLIQNTKRWGRLSQWIIALIITVFLVDQMLWTTQFKRWLGQHYTYGEETEKQTFTPLVKMLPVRAALQNYEDILIIGGSPHQTNTYVWSPLLYRTARCVRDVVVDGGQIIVRPAGPFAALYPPNNQPYPRKDFYQTGEAQRFDMRPGEGSYVVYAHTQAPAWDGPPIVQIEDAPIFSYGSQVKGFFWDAVSRQLGFQWKLHRTKAQDYSYFVHFLDAQGQRLDGYDQSFYSGSYWCDGDELITWIEGVNFPVETVGLRIGMYIYRDGRAVNSESVIVTVPRNYALKPEASP